MHPKKKILYLLTQSELGGAQRYIFDLAVNLNHEFNISVAFGEQGEKGELAKQLKQANIKYYIIPHLKRAVSPWNDFLAFLEIKKLIKKTKPDIIHLNSSKISILGTIAALLAKSAIANRKSQIVYTVHGWVFNEPLPKWKKQFYYLAEKSTAKFKNRIICVSEFDRQTAIKQKIVPEKKLTTIHNGIQPIKFLPKEEARQKLSKKIQNSKFLVGTIANLYPTKGLEYLINAIYLLITNYKLQITAIIIGEGKERKELESIIAQLNLRQNIILAGKIKNAAKLLPAFDIYVCSSVKEGLSYTMIEAMQAGLPIVATKVGGNPELITDNKEGILVAPQNPEKLANGIIKLINNPQFKINLGANARQKSLSEFSLKKMVEKTKNIYYHT